MDGLMVGAGFLMLAVVVSIPARAGKAGIPLIAGALIATILTLLPQDTDRLSRVLGVLLKGALYTVAIALTDGVVRSMLAAGALIDLTAGQVVRLQLLLSISWIITTYEIGVALVGYIDGYPSPGHAVVSDFTDAMSMLRGLAAFGVACVSLYSASNRLDDIEFAATREITQIIGRARNCLRAGILGLLSFWLIFTAPMLLYGIVAGARLVVSPHSTMEIRMWGLTAILICVLGTILAAGVFDYAVLEGRYGSAWWVYLR